MIATQRDRRAEFTKFGRALAHGLRTNKSLALGLSMIIAIGLVALVGPHLVDPADARIGAYEARLRPSTQHWMGTQQQGRDLLTVTMLAIPNSLKVGLIAGSLGLGIGIVFGLSAGYFGGRLDTVVKLASDTLIILPGIAILILVAMSVRTMTVEMMALVVALFAWMYPTRTIRAQTLSLRERGYIQVAKMNGMTGLGIVVREIFPNLLPYIAASFVGAVSGAMLATVGLEALGLGPQNQFTLGMEIYWARFYGAILRGMWWWWMPPVIIIGLVFVALLVTSMGMDQIVNSRLRRST